MSFKAIFQFFLHLHDFLNIDIPNQGAFRIRASIYHIHPNRSKIYATPFQFRQTPKFNIKGSKKIQRQQCIQPPYFYSKSIVIRYSDELVAFEDRVRFKLEIQSFPKLHSQDVYLQFELLYSQFSYSSSFVPEETDKSVGIKIFKLENIEQGIMNYYEAQYLGTYPSKFSFTVFACLSNFQFGKYKLPSQINVKQFEDQGGSIKLEQINNGNIHKIRIQDRDRSKVQTFEQLLKWVGANYKQQVDDSFTYFYETYVKNLRYYFYLAQEKLNNNSLIKQKIILKVPRQFLEFEESKANEETWVSQKEFRHYITNYEPKNLTAKAILEEINYIYADIYMFLLEVEKQFALFQLMSNKMKREYEGYIRQRYGQRIFRYTVKRGQKSFTSQENKKIAMKMRQKQKMIVANYQIVDIDLVEGKQSLQYLFYQITEGKQKEKSFQMVKSLLNIATSLKNEEPSIFQQKLPEKLNIIQQNILNCQLQSQNEISHQVHDEEEDVYKNVSYEKGSVDSERTEKSDDYLQSGNDHFSGISEIQLKKETGKTSEYQNQIEKLFQEVPELKYNQQSMLIVMCHGFQGSYYDMTVILRGIKQMLPKAHFLISRSNQGLTEGDIPEMGLRLSKQIENYIMSYMESETAVLNFIGHSMGGIIARASLKHLFLKYKDRFGFFCSLSSPHIGYLTGVDGMIKAGLWAILKFKPIRSLQQLKMDDCKNLRETFMYKLSKEGSLKRFRKIIFFSSFQDSYVSWNSARVCSYSIKKSEPTEIENEMIENILGGKSVHRIDVNFNVKSKNLDSLIGRTAHINLIIQPTVFKIINSVIPELFDIRK